MRTMKMLRLREENMQLLAINVLRKVVRFSGLKGSEQR